MLIRELLEKENQNEQYTFVIAKAVKDDHSPFYDYVYKQTPIRYVKEWLEGNWGSDYIIIKADTCPIDITGIWDTWYKRGEVKCVMITTEKDLFLQYSENQAKEMLTYYDKEARKQLAKPN